MPPLRNGGNRVHTNAPQRTGCDLFVSYITVNQIGTWNKRGFCGLTFVALSRVIPLSGLLFIKELGWELVKKLGGKFLQLRLEDLACRYQGT